MERELNKLFNDTNYNKENVIIREIWSIKLEFPNFFEEFSYTKEGVEPPLRWSTSQCVEANVPLADHVRCVAALPKFVRERDFIQRKAVTLYGHNGAML